MRLLALGATRSCGLARGKLTRRRRVGRGAKEGRLFPLRPLEESVIPRGPSRCHRAARSTGNSPGAISLPSSTMLDGHSVKYPLTFSVAEHRSTPLATCSRGRRPPQALLLSGEERRLELLKEGDFASADTRPGSGDPADCSLHGMF